MSSRCHHGHQLSIPPSDLRLQARLERVVVRRDYTSLFDFYDFYRYGIYSYLETPTKPYGMRVAERLKKAIEVDPTRAVVDYNKILRTGHPGWIRPTVAQLSLRG